MKSTHQATVCLWLLALTAPDLTAATLAYWRFEEGTLNSNVPADGDGGNPAFANTVIDSSGNANHMRTWRNDTTPKYITPGTSTVSQTGVANTRALEFNPNQDIYTTGSAVDSANLTGGFTVEASIRADSKKWQVFVGKDGRPTGHQQSPFWFKQRDDNGRLEVNMLDAAGATIGIETINAISNGDWYHLAAVNNGSTLAFYLKGPGDTHYVLQGTQITSGGMTNSTAGWSIGRGVWQGNLSDWIDGAVDEVRISNTALAPSAFLMSSAVAMPSISSVTLNTTSNALELNITNIPAGTFHITSSDTLDTFVPLAPPINFDSQTGQSIINIPVTPNIVPKMFFRVESGASPVTPQ